MTDTPSPVELLQRQYVELLRLHDIALTRAHRKRDEVVGADKELALIEDSIFEYARVLDQLGADRVNPKGGLHITLKSLTVG